MSCSLLPPVLEARALRKSYGGVVAVAGLSLSVPRGQILALIGPNGAGKSTTFNLLTGHLSPDSGDVLLNGKSLAGLPPRRIWRMGVGRTFQVAATFGSMTVLENVQMGLISAHNRYRALWPWAGALYRDQAMTLLDLVGLGPLAPLPCATLAYGDVKRLELALALVNNPHVLLMDEPTAGMALAERESVMELTVTLARQRTITVVFTEHDMDVVFRHADRVAVINRGTLLADGTPDEVQQNEQVRDVYLGRGATYGKQAPDAER